MKKLISLLAVSAIVLSVGFAQDDHKMKKMEHKEAVHHMMKKKMMKHHMKKVAKHHMMKKKMEKHMMMKKMEHGK